MEFCNYDLYGHREVYADHIVVTVMHKSLSAQSDVELGQAIRPAHCRIIGRRV